MKPGAKFGAYVVERPLASGGMGSVLLATGAQGEHVAVKTVNTESAAETIGLRREIRALLAIDHPTIVKIVDHGLFEATPWFAMEFIEGASLRDYFSSGYETQKMAALPVDTFVNTPTLPMHTDEAVEAWNQLVPVPEEQREMLGYISSILRGLGHVHAAGLVHRDLKPENIVVRRRDGQPVLVDFGIATQSASGHRERFTRVATTAGTPAYISPEQAQGLWSDARADLYSVGCMIFEILTGHPPYSGTSAMEVIMAHVVEPIPELPADVDPKLAKLVRRLLAKRPEDRPGYGHDVAMEIDHILGLEEVAETAPIYLYRPEFVGRDEAMERCEQALDQLVNGQGGLTVIAAPSGGGKTRFAIELTARIDTDPLVEGMLIEISPRRSSDRSPFTAILSEIVDRCRDQGPVFTREVFGADAGVLAKVHPPILELPGLEDVVAPPDIPISMEIMRRAQGGTNVVTRLFRGTPVVVVVDEIDPRLMKFLLLHRSLLRAHPTPLALFVTVNDQHHQALKEFSQQEIVRLRPLTGPESDRFVETALALKEPPSELVDFVRGAHGNPAQMAEYVRSAVEQGLVYRERRGAWVAVETPQRWDVLRQRDRVVALAMQGLRALPPASQLLARMLAVYGNEMPLELAKELGDKALGPLLQSGLLELRRDVIDFVESELFAEIPKVLSSSEAQWIHLRLAQALAVLPEANPETAAHHYLKAGKIQEARATLLKAANGIELTQTMKAWSYFSAYLATDPPDSHEHAKAIWSLVLAGGRLGRMQECADYCRTGMAMAARIGDLKYTALFRAQFAYLDQHLPFEEAEAMFASALKDAENIGDQKGLWHIHNVRGSYYLQRSRFVLAEADISRARKVLLRGDDVFAAALVLMNHAAALLSLRRYDDAVDALDESLDLCRQYSLPYVEAYVLGNLSVVVGEHLHDPERALELAQDAGRLHKECFDSQGEAMAAVNEAEAWLQLEPLERAVQAAERAVTLTTFSDVGASARSTARAVLMSALARMRRFDEAREVMGDALRGGAPVNIIDVAARSAQIERRTGRLEAAQQWIDLGAQQFAHVQPKNRVKLICERAMLEMALGESPDMGGLEDAEEQQRDMALLLRALKARDRGETLWFGERRDDVAQGMPGFAFENEPGVFA